MTRWERFQERRTRYLQRAKRQANRGRLWVEAAPGQWLVVGRKWPVQRGPRQGVYLADASRLAGPGPGLLPPGFAVVVPPITRDNPAHPRVELAGVLYRDLFPGHFTDAVARYHLRPVLTTRWVPQRGKKLWRQDRAARTCAFYYGYWPDWDPFSRSPSQTAVANGADPVTFTSFPPPAATREQ